MALQTIPGVMWIPDQPLFVAAVPGFSTTLIADASTERLAVIITVPKTGTLDKFEFRTGTVSGFPTGETVRASFQTVSAGFPDNTADEFRDCTAQVASDTWVVPGLITSDGTDTGVKRSVTRGETLACVIDYTAWTNGSIVWSSILATATTIASKSWGHAYTSLFTGTWAANERHPVVALKYNDGTYEFIPGCWPIAALNTTTFNSTSTPDERGLIFQFPFPATLWGFWIRADLDNAADVVLYDSDGTSVIETVTLDVATRPVATGVSYARPFASSRNILANTNYRLVLKPGASDVSLYDFDVSSAAIMDAVEGGQEFHYTHRTDAGAWTQTTTKRPWMGLLISALDDGVSAGGTGRGLIFGG